MTKKIMNSKPKYLYIDDEDAVSTQPIADGLNDSGVVDVELFKVEKLRESERNFDGLIKKISHSQFDGLILDLRLDEKHGNGFYFRAPAVAQELRSRAIEIRGIRPTPIVLCSTDTKMKATYISDKSSHDLFDYKFEKDTNPDWVKIADKLCALAIGYDALKKHEMNAIKILSRSDLSFIDKRIIEILNDSERLPSVHSRASFIINSIFEYPGALISEEVMAARLGINIIKNEKSWSYIRDVYLKECRYSGIFSEGWARWWADQVSDWFNKKTKLSLESIDASRRVQELKKITGKKLTAAEPIKYNYSTKYWTICEGCRCPLDPLEGFWIYEGTELKPWQGHRYLSLNACLERIGIDKGLRIHPSEVENFEIQKKRILIENEKTKK